MNSNSNTRQINMFIGAMAVAAAVCVGYASIGSHAMHPYYALVLLALASSTSRMKVKLPGIDGNMSVNLPFLLAAVVNLSAVEAVSITFISTMVQCWPTRGMKPKTQQIIFNVSMMAFASSVAGLMFHAAWLRGSAWAPEQLAISLAAATLFFGQTVPVAAIIAMSDDGALARIWWNLAQLSFPYYVVSAGMSFMMQTVDHRLGWGAALIVFPVMYAIHRSFRIYFANAAESFRTGTLTRAARAGA